MANLHELMATAARLHKEGRLREAEGLYLAVLRGNPDHARALHLSGLVQHQLGDSDRAVAGMRRALELEPDVVLYHKNLGIVYQSLGEWDHAEQCFRAGLRLQPAHPECLFALACLLQNRGHLDAAVNSFRQLLRNDPHHVSALNNLGNVLSDLGAFDEALSCFRRAIQLKPEHFRALNNLGVAYKRQNQLADALPCFERAISIEPRYASAHNNLGAILRDLGRMDEAIAAFRRALALQPELADVHSNLLLSMQYLPGVSRRQLADEHVAWHRQHAATFSPLIAAASGAVDSERPLRIGFVSADFGQHAVGFFLIGLLESLDKECCQTYCYSDRGREDELTMRLKAAASHWRPAVGLSDRELAERIHDDKIDLLFDLAGHTAGNRLLVFARRPAPLQITWAGYVGTTGLATMDYLLADDKHVPAELDSAYAERVIRLPFCYVCYAPPRQTPPVSSSPVASAGYVTFGSFNNACKINEEVIRTWSSILDQVQDSRLLLKYRGFGHSDTRRRVHESFAACGIAADRVQLEAHSPHHELLNRYGDVDIALDTFPYSGGLTTCEAVWMGVPVVTVPGETFAGRHAFSYLTNLQLDELIASDRSDYVRKSVELASNRERLHQLRGQLRNRLEASPICDAKAYARRFEEACRDIWRRHCRENPR